VFDRDSQRIGQKIGDLVVRDTDDIQTVAAEQRVDMGVIATPMSAAQEVADLLVAVGVRGILNFAPRKVFVPPHVALRNVDMTVELESLSFSLAQKAQARGRRGSA
jgi:redox-sensing transcriptional repressor